ncbi:hypothetical protein [Pseudodesulfovibrio methanolicus]|uniref:DUF2513 domain-containing protein n=1 Tax=Pseudodesulfovibrio methanolicus TaxID=3126690 RepID=A0ABZ2J1D4_9BACT
MLNREFQRKTLEYLRDEYPGYAGCDGLKRLEVNKSDEQDDGSIDYHLDQIMTPKWIMANLSYLAEHGLVAFVEARGLIVSYAEAKITAKGLDFLEDDGGLSAILNTVTVKFDVDNVRELVEVGLLTAHVPEDKQGALLKAIRKAPGTMLQTAVTKMVEKGMSDPVGTAKAVAGLFGVSW